MVCNIYVYIHYSINIYIIYSYLSLLSKPYPQCATPTIDNASTNKTESVAILKYVFDCLHSPKVNNRICSFIMEMVVNLLSDGKVHEEGHRDRLHETPPNEEELDSFSGRSLVQPFVPGLLDYLSRAISECTYKGKLRKKDGRERDLDKEFIVLSRLVCWSIKKCNSYCTSFKVNCLLIFTDFCCCCFCCDFSVFVYLLLLLLCLVLVPL